MMEISTEEVQQIRTHLILMATDLEEISCFLSLKQDGQPTHELDLDLQQKSRS